MFKIEYSKITQKILYFPSIKIIIKRENFSISIFYYNIIISVKAAKQHLFGVKFHLNAKNWKKRNILLQYSFLLNKIVKFSPKKIFFEKLSPHLDSDFSLLANF